MDGYGHFDMVRGQTELHAELRRRRRATTRPLAVHDSASLLHGSVMVAHLASNPSSMCEDSTRDPGDPGDI